MLFHEAPHKLRTTLGDFLSTFGAERRIAICRELTKLNEEVLRTTLAEAVAYYEQKEPRGEYVLVLEGGSGQEIAAKQTAPDCTPEEMVRRYLEKGYARNEAIKEAARELGLNRKELYNRMIGK